MDGDGQSEKESNGLMEKKGTDRSAETNELTLPEKLCRFYVERPKLAFGMFVFDCLLSHNLATYYFKLKPIESRPKILIIC